MSPVPIRRKLSNPSDQDEQNTYNDNRTNPRPTTPMALNRRHLSSSTRSRILTASSMNSAGNPQPLSTTATTIRTLTPRLRPSMTNRPIRPSILNPSGTSISEISARRNRMTLMASRRRAGTTLPSTTTSLASGRLQSQTANSGNVSGVLNLNLITPTTTELLTSSTSENHNNDINANNGGTSQRRISFSEYANSLNSWINLGMNPLQSSRSNRTLSIPVPLSSALRSAMGGLGGRDSSHRSSRSFNYLSSSSNYGHSSSTQQQQLTSVTRVMEKSEKHLEKIFQFLNWSELLPLRLVNKKWLEVISMSPVSNRLGTIVVKNPSWENVLQLFNDSPVTWTSFRFEASMYVDVMDPVQLQFWMKHGPQMKHLEIRNKALTLTGLVEILNRCPNLASFMVNWTPEMYPFNSELIKKYYGLNFYNGNFPNMHELKVERSCFLNDTALSSLLKWCGSTLKSLSLTYPPENEQDPLTRLKPRWTVTPLKNYIERFGYAGNLQHLDFSWSNLCPADLDILGSLTHLSKLRTLALNHCRLDDISIKAFLHSKGSLLESLELEDVPVTEVIFTDNLLPVLKSLNISGSKGNFKQLGFLLQMPKLEELKASRTIWLDYNKFMPFLKVKNQSGTGRRPFKKLDISGGIKVNGTKQIDVNMNRVWFTNLSNGLTHLTSLNLGGWTQFGKGENFKTICMTMKGLRELIIRDWKELNDSAVTGFPPEKIHSGDKKVMISKKDVDRNYVGCLKGLVTLDLSGCNVSDASVKYGIVFLNNLRNFFFDKTQISDSGINYLIQKNQSVDRISFKGCDKVLEKNNHKYQRLDGRWIYAK